MAYSRTLNHFTSMQELATIWASSTSYLVNQPVIHNNFLYRCAIAHTSSGSFQTDLAAGNWERVSSAENGINWASSTYYVLNQLVVESDKLYKCLVAHTSGGTFIADLQAAYWVEISASEAGVFNYIGNPDAEVDASGWTTYAESDSVTFTDAGDLVTLNNHGLSNGNEISFTSITSTTGISINTRYFVVSATTNTFQVASSSGGSALPLTTNGSGTMVRFVPKTGSGGSPNITWSRSIVSPLRGEADFNLVKDAANRQGQGVEYDFTIDNADLAKVLTVTFDYEVVSGTLATGDVTVYLIQDPSGTPLVIQPAGYQVQGATVGTKMRQIATFQTSSTVTSYRLCLHVSSVSATAYTLAVDNVVVGPQVVQYGAPVTDWQDFPSVAAGTLITATTTNPTFGTIAVNKAQWRRVGGDMEIRWDFRQTTGGTLGSGTYLFNLPSGFDIDSNRASISSIDDYSRSLGVFHYSGINPATDVGTGYVTAYSSKQLKCVFQYQSGTTNTATGVWGSTFGQLNGVLGASILAKVPILGWSSTVQMSNDTDTRVVAASVGNGSAVNATVQTVIVPFGSTVLDTHGGVGSNQYIVPVAGYYRVGAQSRTSFSAGNVTFNHSLSIFNGATAVATDAYQGDGANTAGLSWAIGSVSQIIRCSAGDVLTVRFTTNYTGATSTTLQFFSVERLSGPSAIAASETVAARYTIAAGVSTSTTQPVNFATRVFDTHGAVTTGASWRFTAPIAGKYQVSTSGAITAGAINCDVYKNGALYTTLCSWDSATIRSGAVLIEAIAGDYFDIRGTTSVTTNSLATNVHVSIHRIGN